MWSGLKMLAFIMLPVTAVLIIMGEPIIRLLFEREEFTRQSTIETTWALIFLAIGFFPYAARDLLTRVLYSLQDTRTPVIINTFTIILNVIFSIILVRFLDQGGLGLGMALGGFANFIIMLYAIRRKLGLVVDRNALVEIGKIVVAVIVMSVVLWLIQGFYFGSEVISDSAICANGINNVSYSLLEQLTDLLLLYAVAGASFIISCFVLKVDIIGRAIMRLFKIRN
jgi:putative peptidoglycan lipid II flippase